MTEKEKLDILVTIEKVKFGELVIKFEEGKIVFAEIRKRIKFSK